MKMGFLTQRTQRFKRKERKGLNAKNAKGLLENLSFTIINQSSFVKRKALRVLCVFFAAYA